MAIHDADGLVIQATFVTQKRKRFHFYLLMQVYLLDLLDLFINALLHEQSSSSS
jgi:hypothetical protein